MKKLLSFTLCSLLLCGCMSNHDKNEKEYNEKYENYMGFIIDNSKQVTTNLPFKWTFNMVKTDDGYSYDVKISEPKVAMYNIQMIVADISEISASQVSPSIGIFEGVQYNMIPNQVNTEKGFFEGIGINGVSPKEKFTLNCMVVYKDRNQTDNYVYFMIDADYADFKDQEKQKVEKEEQKDE